VVLVNGAEGIGTGWATSIPCYNPLDIVNNLRDKLNNKIENFRKMHPWYKGFTGIIENGEREGKYLVKGKFERAEDNKLIITDLPVKRWTREYKNFLEELA
jgi:DNA topoisomerase-2